MINLLLTVLFSYTFCAGLAHSASNDDDDDIEHSEVMRMIIY